MQYDYLAEFVTVAREQNITKAARKLSLTPSVLSRHINALETDIGAKLLLRTTHGVRLTDEGEYVFSKGADIVDIADNISKHFNSIYRKERTITISGFRGNPRQLSIFSASAKLCEQDSEQVTMQFLHYKMDSPIKKLLAEKLIDIFLTMPAEEELDSLRKQYSVVEVAVNPLTAIMEKTHPLAKHDHLALTDLKDTLILRGEGRYYDGIISWKEFKRICLLSGFLPDSRAIPSYHYADWCMMNFENGILVFGGGNENIEHYLGVDKVSIPILDDRSSLIAIYDKENELAGKIIDYSIKLQESL